MAFAARILFSFLLAVAYASVPTFVHAAITYSTQGAVAVSAASGTSVAPAYPTGIAAGDLLVVVIGMKPSVANGGTVTTPGGWTPITSLTGAGGYGTTLAADTGNTNVYGYYKTATGSETGTLTVTIGSNSVTWAQMYLLKGGAGSTWDIAGTTGSDIAGGSVSIAHSSNPGVTAGDYVIGGMVIPTDVTTPAQFSAEALSQAGITFGTVTEVSEPDSSNGNDIGGVTYRAPVNSGTASAAPTFTATAGGTTTNVRGPGIFIRVREVLPSISITGYTNSTESGLNYAASCTGCGARIGGGAGFRQTVVISGVGFGADPGAGNRSTATNNVKVGTNQIADANVTAWSNTSITILTDSNVAGDTDADWGTNFGGASALTVTGSGATSAGVNFYVFPQVTSITTNTGVADGAREYDAGDTDGVVTLNGTRFGSGQGTGYVRILGCDASTCSSPSGSVTINSWSTTAIQARVPTVIADTSYTGSILMQQGTGGNSKTHTYANTFRVLPRITGFTPSSGSVGDAVTVNGNHFCQNGGTCPTSFTASNKVTFTSGVDATAFTSWTSTAMQIQVPSGAASGAVVLTSNGFASNGESFTVTTPVPNTPTSLNQYSDSGLTSAIPTGGGANATPIYLTMTMSAGVSGGTLYPQIEYKPIGTAFSCSGTGACALAAEGTGVAGPGPVSCAIVGNGCAIAISPGDNVYHWQARVRHNKSGVDYYSAWISFPTLTPNLESETDFEIDSTAPTISGVDATNVESNSATIVWNTTGEPSTSQVQYNITGTFGACGGDCTTLDTNLVTNHSVALSSLDSGTTYYYRVRSRDSADNETVSSNGTFTTTSVTEPAKTVRFHIPSVTEEITGGSETTTDFTVVMPETGVDMKSSFIELRLLYTTTGSAPNGITLEVNTEGAETYDLPTVSDTGYLTILHPVISPQEGPAANTLMVLPGSNTSIRVLSADITLTYGYTP